MRIVDFETKIHPTDLFVVLLTSDSQPMRRERFQKKTIWDVEFCGFCTSDSEGKKERGFRRKLFF